MTGSATTKSIKDGAAASFSSREWDESGVGTGPFSAMPVLGDGAGAALPKAEDDAHVSGDYGIMSLGVRKDTAVALGADGDYHPPIYDSSGKLWVNAVVSAGATAGDVANDAADSGNPVKVGSKAIAGLSTATLVAAADRVENYAGLDGALIVRPHCGLEDIVSAVVTCTSGANTSAISAQGSGIKVYVTSVIIRNAGTSNGNLLLTDGSGGTTKADIPFPASTGTVWNPPVPLGFSANTAIFADPSGSDNIIVTVIGFKSKV